jgi:hypothetical protein
VGNGKKLIMEPTRGKVKEENKAGRGSLSSLSEGIPVLLGDGDLGAGDLKN